MKKILFALGFLIAILVMGYLGSEKDIAAGRLTVAEALLPLVFCWAMALLFCYSDVIIKKLKALSASKKRLLWSLLLLIVIEAIYLVLGATWWSGLFVWALLMALYLALRMSKNI